MSCKTIPAMAFLAALAPAFALAASYDYTCRYLSDTKETVRIQVSKRSMKMFDQADGSGRSSRGTVLFRNEGLKGGNGKMRERLVFRADYDKSEVAPGEITEFFLSPELVEGGMKLRNGSLGGFMTFAGHGFSYESYICFRD